MNPVRLTQKQNGAALIVGLMLLIVVTLVAISGIKSTSIQQSMSTGMQQNMLVYQAADTMIQQVLATINSTEAPPDLDGDGVPGPHILVSVISNNDATQDPPQPAAQIPLAVDPNDRLGKPTAVAQMSLVGTTNLVPGCSVGSCTGFMFLIDATADFVVENTQANNRVGVLRKAPYVGP